MPVDEKGILKPIKNLKTLGPTVWNKNFEESLKNIHGCLSIIYEKVAVAKGLTAMIGQRTLKGQPVLMLSSQMEQLKELNSYMWEADQALLMLEKNFDTLKTIYEEHLKEHKPL